MSGIDVAGQPAYLILVRFGLLLSYSETLYSGQLDYLIWIQNEQLFFFIDMLVYDKERALFSLFKYFANINS